FILLRLFTDQRSELLVEVDVSVPDVLQLTLLNFPRRAYSVYPSIRPSGLQLIFVEVDKIIPIRPEGGKCSVIQHKDAKMYIVVPAKIVQFSASVHLLWKM
ncbi:MAG: hypothetical protein WC875_06035, partial [Candidatus Absconditabacterales bacterium]